MRVHCPSRSGYFDTSGACAQTAVLSSTAASVAIQLRQSMVSSQQTFVKTYTGLRVNERSVRLCGNWSAAIQNQMTKFEDMMFHHFRAVPIIGAIALLAPLTA